MPHWLFSNGQVCKFIKSGQSESRTKSAAERDVNTFEKTK